MDPTLLQQLVKPLGSAVAIYYTSFIFYGVLTAQASAYMNNFPDDTKLQKIAVLETFNTAVTIAIVYNFTIWSASDPWLLTKISCFSVCALLAVRCVFAIASAVYSARPGTNTFLGFHDTRVSYAVYFGWLASGAVSDASTAAALCYLLCSTRSDIRSTKQLIRRNLILVLNSGVLTSAIAVGGLAAFFWSNTVLNNGVLSIASKLHANSFFGMLNARNLFRSHRSTIHVLPESGFKDLLIPAIKHRAGVVESHLNDTHGNDPSQSDV
ncbi:hypothetical protein EIP91_005812 [Steccherinum ochraceum]|uniref:DUF6534 domain-containing protein n=1 Tax=Steccherinum ochraceum TaxID=92696 RepID=A0A4V2MVM8_9APHY|nr:hypothetical protein EIP91_005812 [Steccherinum ochraceum]